MKLLIGIVILVVGVGYFFVPKKNKIGKKLEKAKQLLDEGELVKVNRMLDEIIIFPLNEKYTADYATSLIASLNFLKVVCKEQNISKDALIDPLLVELKRISSEGGKIDSSLTEPLEDWIDKMAKDAYSQAKNIIRDADTASETPEDEKDEDFTSEVFLPEELAVINSIGNYLLRRKYKDGIDFVNRHMPLDMSAFKATLLDQKAALYFMDGNVKEAINHYEEILNHYPENYRIKSSLAEGYVELKEFDLAMKYAKEVANFSKNSDLVKTCNKIVNKYNQ